MYKGNFSYCERNMDLESDNQIIYFAGPIKISISGWDGYIVLESKKKWSYLLDECLEIAKEAWQVEDNQIKKEENKILIKYNYNNIKLYIEHSIIFI